MKSKRAQKELEKLERRFFPFIGRITLSDAYRIAEIAERDAEERMRKKAAKVYCQDCCYMIAGEYICGIGSENCESRAPVQQAGDGGRLYCRL